ncbi:MAG: Protein-export membrane protein SecD (TC 3.A.5.1.1) / Protein-export membrane protein SecF (TC 3.A.5.1.1) [uncultured Aureispira sp.]|uniref:Multifunctional fusion protein n=1 Tax=uncultured Aureispira sp. TaxID=1331704 RepID=A0A6S6U9L5_9BACT|nr:MAG: Protein-export membrane protein SecD (TC 3.A.5.1.1) / Protein-export membrane protein SecF (TC 3.A.5.1.1) [uncultured Aureispira sp.]
MQGKALIKFFTGVALLVVAYQFLLWFPTKSVESNADQYASASISHMTDSNEKEERRDSFRNAYLDSVSNKTVFTIPLIKSYNYQELKQQQIAWGLDLQGGMSVVMQVDLKELIIVLSGKSSNPEFLKALDLAKVAQQSAQTDYVTLFGEEYSKLSDKPLARLFSVSDRLKGEVGVGSTNEEVLTAIRKVAEETVESTYNLLKKRIDRYGVAQPVVSLDKNTDRITVELPGVRNPKRARKYLVATANLEFWELHQNADLQNELISLNETLREQAKLNAPKDTTPVLETPVLDTTGMATDTTGIEGDSTLAGLGDLGGEGDLAGDSTDAGPLFEILGLNFAQTNADLSGVIGYAELSNVAAVEKILKSKAAKKALGSKARSIRFVWDSKPFENTKGQNIVALYALNTKGRDNSVLSGERVVQSYPTPNPSGNGFAVSLSMDQEGARIWKKMTTDNVGRQVAVVLDNKVYSAPNVNEPIPNGNTSISGGFAEVTEAKDLANILSIGKLPARPEIIEEAVVGPSLGAATVSAGIWSLVGGFLLVLLFMLGYYSMAGVIAVLALFLNIFFIFGSLASFGTVLTLPGIAGIVLTIGMAVDANVIIFERIREELRGGQEWKAAIAKGFSHSYSAILDANITTLIVAGILYNFGLGPIKGFATVLIIGVVCSVFSAVLIGRMIFDSYMERNKEVSVWASWSKNILANPGIDFVSKRKVAYGISGLILTAGIISMFTNGFELGVDLQGGRSYTVQFAENVDATAFKGKIEEAFTSVGKDKTNVNKTVVREFSKSTQAKITTSFLQTELEIDADSVILRKVYEGAKAYSGNDISYDDFAAGEPVEGGQTGGFYLSASSKVGPTIADDIRNSAGWAAALSLIFIFLYILLRFNRWQYSAGALAALVHDVLFVLSIFSLFKGIMPFSLEIDQAFIAAILTVIGYSINDTVVVFDRIREVGRDMQDKASFEDIVNTAVNNTVSRTCITSLTTLLVVLILFLFGGSGISGFAFALLIGILVGTYSSIFIATPVVVDTTGNSNIFDAPIVEEVVAEEENPEAPEA